MQEQYYILEVHLTPRAKRNEVKGRHGTAVKIRLRAPPVDGKANQALLKFLAGILDLPVADLELIVGQTSRNKRIRIQGLSGSEIWRRLGVPPV